MIMLTMMITITIPITIQNKECINQNLELYLFNNCHQNIYHTVPELLNSVTKGLEFT
jgi:hypothetical protein